MSCAKYLKKYLPLLLPPCLCLFIFACAQTPGGSFIVNEQTVENFIDKDVLHDDKGGLKAYDPASDLNLLWDEPVAAAKIPALAPNEMRIGGTLSSAGPYVTTAKPQADFPGAIDRGSTFQNSVYGMLGPAASGGTAWFYANVDKMTGRIVSARAYLYGFNGGVCDMRQPAGGSYGQIRKDSFTLTIDGYCAFPGQQGSMAEYALLVEGEGDILSSGARPLAINYLVDNNGAFKTIPKNPKSYWVIFDYGTGEAQTEN